MNDYPLICITHTPFRSVSHTLHMVELALR